MQSLVIACALLSVALGQYVGYNGYPGWAGHSGYAGLPGYRGYLGYPGDASYFGHPGYLGYRAYSHLPVAETSAVEVKAKDALKTEKSVPVLPALPAFSPLYNGWNYGIGRSVYPYDSVYPYGSPFIKPVEFKEKTFAEKKEE